MNSQNAETRPSWWSGRRRLFLLLFVPVVGIIASNSLRHQDYVVSQTILYGSFIATVLIGFVQIRARKEALLAVGLVAAAPLLLLLWIAISR